MQLNGLSLAITNVLGGRLNPLSWFAAGEQGAWYDPSDLTTLFQDSAGTIPVTAVEQPVGLMLDKSKGLALGAELVTNGTFDVDISGVTQIGGVGIIRDTSIFTTGGLKLTAIQPGNSGIYAQISIPTVVGATYSLSADLYAPATNSVSLSCFLTATNTAGTEGINISANGVVQRKTCVFSATSTTTLIKAFIMNHGVAYGTTGDVAYYDNISVKQIAGNHAFQATAGNRPLLSARVNLLTKTEDFSDAVWTKRGTCVVTPNATTDPLGGNTADLLSNVGASSTDDIYYTPYNNVVVPASVPITLVIFIKKVSTTGTLQIGAPIGLAYGRWNVDLSLLSSGWEKLTATHPAVTVISPYVGSASGNGIVVYAASVGKLEFYIWGADLRPTNAGALLPPYQRVNTASDYDTIGFPLYLKANGTSSAMSTNSVDFSSTDKMTVVTGVRKLSDDSDMLMELSSNTATDSFYLTTPFTSSNYGFGTGGGAVVNSSYTTPSTDIISNSVDRVIGGLHLTYNNMRVNGSTSATRTTAGNTTIAGNQNFGNYPLYLFSRGGTQLYLNGQFYGAIIRGAQSDTASVTQTEQYMATKTGITF